jgi:hypothetical protein
MSLRPLNGHVPTPTSLMALSHCHDGGRRGPRSHAGVLYLVVKQLRDVIARGGGRSSIPETAVMESRGLWNTRCPACAGHDSERDVTPHSRGAIASGSCKSMSLLKHRGRREHRMLAAPAGLACKESALCARQATTGQPKQSGVPCAMALRLIARSPRGTGLVSPRRLRTRHPHA